MVSTTNIQTLPVPSVSLGSEPTQTSLGSKVRHVALSIIRAIGHFFFQLKERFLDLCMGLVEIERNYPGLDRNEKLAMRIIIEIFHRSNIPAKEQKRQIDLLAKLPFESKQAFFKIYYPTRSKMWNINSNIEALEAFTGGWTIVSSSKISDEEIEKKSISKAVATVLFKMNIEPNIQNPKALSRLRPESIEEETHIINTGAPKEFASTFSQNQLIALQKLTKLNQIRFLSKVGM